MLSVRFATPDDASLVMTFFQEFAAYDRLPSVITEEQLRRDAFGAQPKFRVLIAETDGIPAGYALFFDCYSSLRGPAIFLEDLFVLAQYRRKGVGRALLAHVARIAEARHSPQEFEKPGVEALGDLKHHRRKPMAKSTFVYVTYIRTMPERLWSTLTDAEFMKQYRFGLHGESQWTAGSTWKLVHPDGRIAAAGEIVEAQLPRRLVIRWQDQIRHELRAEGESRCTMELESKGPAARLAITHSIEREPSNLIALVSSSRPKGISNLKSLLETGSIVLQDAFPIGSVHSEALKKGAKPDHLPSGFHALTAHLTVTGARQYIEFLKRVFDAVELSRSALQDGRLLNASVRVGDSVLMLNDVFPEFGGEAYRSGRALRLTLYLPDADAAWTKALAAGCKVASPIREQFWGDRYGEVEDPFGDSRGEPI
jgi:uncharacterized glyoxalase superfamily protein PhnB/uncharacterized protein YndB with AHSA1/START domain